MIIKAMYQYVWATAKIVCRGKFTEINNFVRKEKDFPDE